MLHNNNYSYSGELPPSPQSRSGTQGVCLRACARAHVCVCVCVCVRDSLPSQCRSDLNCNFAFIHTWQLSALHQPLSLSCKLHEGRLLSLLLLISVSGPARGTPRSWVRIYWTCERALLNTAGVSSGWSVLWSVYSSLQPRPPQDTILQSVPSLPGGLVTSFPSRLWVQKKQCQPCKQGKLLFKSQIRHVFLWISRAILWPCFFFFLIGGKLLHNVMLISAIQQY